MTSLIQPNYIISSVYKLSFSSDRTAKSLVDQKYLQGSWRLVRRQA